ncbi:MAG: 2OG-Fe(II) oxygenase [Bacteroidota bacterium]
MDKDEETRQDQIQFEHLIQGLIHQKFGCCDDFMDTTVVAGLRNNIRQLRDSGSMQSAGFGKKLDYQKNSSIRGDKIRWIEADSQDTFEEVYLKKIGNFIRYLNETCYTSINSFESHYASYEQESFYKRHRDQFHHDKGRKYSIVLYLNENWQQEDAGLLSLYPSASTQVDIAPIGGRMVFFKSDEMEHEVHPSFTRNRISIAGWLKS